MPLSPWRRRALAALAIAVATHAAVVLAFPRILMALVLSRIEARAGTNRAFFAPRPDHTFRAIVRPSPDLLYSVCVVDLRAAGGEVEIDATLPPTYGSLALYDASTDVVEVLRDRDFQGGIVRARVVALGAPERADGVRTLRLSTRRGLILQRVLAVDEASLPEAERARRGLRCRPRGLDR